MIKSALKHEVYSTQVDMSQHKSTRVSTNQDESDTKQHESDTNQQDSTRVQHESTQINTSPAPVNTNQRESKTSLDYKKYNKYGYTKSKSMLSVVFSRKICGALHLLV